jgi:hypothetical protein
MEAVNKAKPKRVRFKDEEYWLADGRPWSDYNLSPLDHYDEDGNLLANPFVAISYAIVEDGDKIMRFGEQIGTLADLEYL